MPEIEGFYQKIFHPKVCVAVCDGISKVIAAASAGVGQIICETSAGNSKIPGTV